MENYNKEMENNLLGMVKQKEESDRRLLKMEILTGVLCLIPLIGAIVVVNVVSMEEWLASLIVGLCVLPLLIATPFMIKIEQTAGYYKCGKCGHVYVPAYGRVFAAMHMGRTRYMRCPECDKRSWQKKVISKE